MIYLYSSKTNSNDTKFGFFSPNISKSCSKIIDKESLSNQISFSMEVVVNSLVMSARKHSDRSKQLKIIFHRVCVLSFLFIKNGGSILNKAEYTATSHESRSPLKFLAGCDGGRTDGWTDRRTDKVVYKVADSRLKNRKLHSSSRKHLFVLTWRH